MDVGSDPDVLAAHNRQKSDRRVIAHLDTVPAYDRSQSDRHALADPIASEPVNPVLDEPGPQPEQQDLSDGNAGLFN